MPLRLTRGQAIGHYPGKSKNPSPGEIPLLDSLTIAKPVYNSGRATDLLFSSSIKSGILPNRMFSVFLGTAMHSGRQQVFVDGVRAIYRVLSEW